MAKLTKARLLSKLRLAAEIMMLLIFCLSIQVTKRIFLVVNTFTSELSLAEIDSSDAGIYHHLAPVITSSEGMKLFEKVCKLVGTQKDLYKLVNLNGFTPLLLYIQEFARSAEGVYNEYKERLFQEYREKQAKLPQSQQNPIYSAGYNRYNAHHYLTPQETAKLEQDAQKEFDEFVTRFLEKIQMLVDLGANLGDKVQKLKMYRNAPKAKEKVKDIGKDAMVEEKNSNSMDIESAKKNYLRPTEKLNHYGPQGKQTALHLIMSYPHIRIVKLLLESGRIDVNQQDKNKETALNLLINSYNTYT